MSLLTLSSTAKRAPDLGVPLEGMPGAWNAIIDGVADPNCVAVLLKCSYRGTGEGASCETGSILIRVETDAPLLPNQTERRASLGRARLGAPSDNGAGSIFISFPIANPTAAKPPDDTATLFVLPNDPLGPIFEATVENTKENIVNALLASEVPALPIEQAP